MGLRHCFLWCDCGCGIVAAFAVVLIVLFRLGFFVGAVYGFIIVLVYGGFALFCSLLACAFGLLGGCWLDCRVLVTVVVAGGFVVGCFCWYCCLRVVADLLLLVGLVCVAVISARFCG